VVAVRARRALTSSAHWLEEEAVVGRRRGAAGGAPIVDAGVRACVGTTTRASAPGRPPTVQALLGTQATGGNRVAALLVQRWEADEHELLGNKGSGNRAVELAPGYLITFGEMVALAGDHFESVAQMRRFAANTKGGPRSRAEIDYAREWKLGAKGMRYDEKAKAAQEARYYTLAGGNRSHFLNPRTGDAAQDPAVRAGDPRAYLNPKYTTAPVNAS
jgi:hypothetical protein